MKWRNKGHEFDNIGEILKKIDNIYIYGAGEYGEQLGRLFQGVGASYTYIDRNQKKAWNGKAPIQPTEINLKKILDENAIIILALGVNNSGTVLKELELQGFSRKENIYFYAEWISYYIYIYAAYKLDKIILLQCGAMAVYNCTLRCKNCMGAFPYFREKKNVPWEIVKRDIDACFFKIDYVENWGIGCGECFLYENLNDYIIYCMDNYRTHFGRLVLDTNGTVIPKGDVLETIRRYGCYLSISNYSTIPGWQKRVEELERKLKEYEIPYLFVNYDYWIDMGWREKKIHDKALTYEKFNACSVPCRIVQNGHLNYCIHAMTANQALFHEDVEEDTLDLMRCDKRHLLEFNLGFNENGALKTCAHCNGFGNINSKKISVAEQL